MVKAPGTLRGVRERLTTKGRERRDQLMRTAARLFAERGYHPTSVADIVGALSVGKGVFYWYFTSKDELLAEILRASHHQLRRRQQAAIGDEPDPLRRIERGIRASLEWFGQHREYFAIIQFAATDETFAPVLRRNDDVALADTARHIKEAIVQGRALDQDPEMLARAIHGVIGRLARDYLVDRDEPVDLVADLAVAFVLQGLEI
ncbi:MAG TPA: TetR/AcrR family transcriptional regulator [Acidimicrobiia bacterium]